MTAACTFHLLRHAQHSLLSHTLVGRTPGVALSPTGLAEAQTLASHLQASRARAVVTSPSDRARQTAAPIAAALGLTPQIDPAFDELDFGAWTGQQFDTLTSRADWREWNTARGLARPPGGETMLEVQVRAVAGLRRLAYDGGTVIIVSHGDVIRAVLAYMLGMALDLLHRLDVAPASRSTLLLGAGFAQVTAVNQPL